MWWKNRLGFQIVLRACVGSGVWISARAKNNGVGGGGGGENDGKTEKDKWNLDFMSEVIPLTHPSMDVLPTRFVGQPSNIRVSYSEILHRILPPLQTMRLIRWA